LVADCPRSGASHRSEFRGTSFQACVIRWSEKLPVDTIDINYYLAVAEQSYEIFPSFVQQIDQNTGQNLMDVLTPKFTTTTAVSLAAAWISVMAAMQSYFKDRVMMGGCGRPSVTIEGTVDDWQSISEKLDQNAKSDLQWCVSELKPVLGEIIKAKLGKFDRNFWLRMIQLYDEAHKYEPS
jgi:hypothetical protein